MLDFILNTLVYTFAIYGLFQVIKTILYIMEYTNLKENRNIHNNCYQESRKKYRADFYVLHYLK